MHYVYLIQSINYPNKTYIGYTKDLNERLSAHNSACSWHTAQYKPWKLITCLIFADKSQALNFEKYLKSSSGRAFAAKRLW